jgi:hypothetical protein
MWAARFPGSQAAGDSRVTFSVTVPSPRILYNGWQQKDTSWLYEEAAMKDKTGGSRHLRRAGALAVAAAAVATATTACGVHVNFGSSGGARSSASPPTYAQELALAQCMRGHGVPDFPDPSASGGYTLTSNGSLEGNGEAVSIESSQVQAAYGDCRHLLPGGPSIAQLEQDVQQEQQRQEQELPAMLKYSQCVRGHGVPDFPDPAQNGQSPRPDAGGAVNLDSPQVQAALSACQHLLPAGAHVSIHTSKSAS